jgi:hypothetical protein
MKLNFSLDVIFWKGKWDKSGKVSSAKFRVICGEVPAELSTAVTLVRI